MEHASVLSVASYIDQVRSLTITINHQYLIQREDYYMRYFIVTLILSFSFMVLGCDDNDTTGPGEITFNDLTIQLTNMDPHVNNYMLFRVVDDNANVIRGVIVLDSLRTADEEIEMPEVLTDDQHRLDFYADFNTNGTYDAPPADHAWSIDIPQNGIVTFDHNTNFDDIALLDPIHPGNDFNLNFTGFAPHISQQIEVRVIDTDFNRTVGVYRLDELDETDFTAVIPSIIEEGREYQVDFYADFNDNGEYNAPPTDHAWRMTGTGTASGLTLHFDHNTDFTDVGF
jgi:hypothetical protein